MKKLFISTILITIALTVLFAACTDRYAGYNSSGLTSVTGRWDPDCGTLPAYDGIVSSVDELKENCGNQLNYSEEFFKNNSLVIVIIEGCSSYGITFVDVLEKDGKLYPVLERNYIRPNQPVTEDYILHIFYSEIPKSANYEYGEIVTRYRNKPFLFSGCNSY